MTTPRPRRRFEFWAELEACPGGFAVPELVPGVGCLWVGVPDVPDCDVDVACGVFPVLDWLAPEAPEGVWALFVSSSIVVRPQSVGLEDRW